MENFAFRNVSFAYPEQENNVLSDIALQISDGEFVIVCGPSGCGKSTLLRHMKTCLAPHGRIQGEIFYKGNLLSETDDRTQAQEIGFVLQSPENQVVTDKVWHELAFGLESLGVKQNEIRARVSEMASFFGIENWFYKNVTELSGGQKQLLNLASVMVMQPSVLILDEPTSQLDPISAGEFLNTLKKINQELGVAIIITEHRLEDVFPMADKVIVMDEGKIISTDSPENIGRILKDTNHDMYKALPTPVRVHSMISNTLPCPLTVREGREWLEKYSEKNALNSDAIPKDSFKPEDTVIEVKEAFFRYEKNSSNAVKDFNLKVNKGELFCILGGNGTGKTTALSCISGLNTPQRGEVLIKGQPLSKIKNPYNGLLGVLPQNPQSVFVKKTVYLDLADMLSETHLTKDEKELKIGIIASLCRIEDLLPFHPYDLSGGEQQRCALAKVLLTDPEILLLDEPTKGMDADFKEEFAYILDDLKRNNTTILMVSHDIEFCAENADRCALMFDGGITSVDTPREFFKGKNFYTTAANRMARTVLPDAILSEDIILACNGITPKKERKPIKPEFSTSKGDSKPLKNSEAKVAEISKTEKKLPVKSIISCLLFLLLIPLTIFMGVLCFGGRKYYFISLLVILETMIPFFMLFESKKPKARELVIISVLCGIAVAGRSAFFMIPQFKPVTALVIIAGICFGGETGFLVGAITGFVSNFFFGQGPWTPWQMFSFGIIGFIAGTLFRKGKKNKVILSIFGFLSVIIIYGGIMNPASIIMTQTKINWEMISTAIIMGFPLDLIHALSTAFFLWFISSPMIEKLERVKVKYGFTVR